MKKTNLVKVTESQIENLQTIEKQVQELGLAKIDSGFQKAFAVSTATQNLRQALTSEVMSPIMQMQGSSLGFRTDYDTKGGYPEDVVKEALIEAVLRGVQPAGNQFNIIAGRCYITREGFAYLLKNLTGFTDFKPTYDIPEMKPGRATVNCKATWKMNGKNDSMDCVIPIRVNGNMGADAVLGKAARKLMARVYWQATGTDITDGEALILTSPESGSPNFQPQPEPSKPITADELYGQDNLDMGGEK